MMEFIQISKKRVLVYADTSDRENLIIKLLKTLDELIKKIQIELK